MRVTLFHNPDAGREEYSEERLTRALRKAGHKVIYASIKARDWKKALKKRTHLVVVAGGDGSVGKVARRLIGRKIPLSVLPLGTANNLARTLGFDRPVEKLIREIGQGKRHGFDVGVARGPWGRRYLFEGVGAGLLAEYLRLPLRNGKEKLSKEEEMREHVARLRKLLAKYRARKWKLELDDEKLEGRFLLFEAMNICSVGPVLQLAPRAKTGDGKFNLILAREAERERLMDYLGARLEGDEEPDFPLPAQRFTRLRITWKKAPLHLDDQLWPEKGEKPPEPGEIKIKVKPSALFVLRP